MTSQIRFFCVLLLALIFVGCSNTKPEAPEKPTGLTYRDLLLKDYDEMLAMVKKHVQKAHKLLETSDSGSEAEHDARLELLNAERLILSRPNSDNMVAKLVPDVRKEMNVFGSYDDLLETLTKEGIDALGPDMHIPTTVQTTYLFLLENLMSEVKPEITNNERQRGCLEKIRDAKIDVPREVMAERKLQGMFLTESPSFEAKRILDAAGFKKKRR